MNSFTIFLSVLVLTCCCTIVAASQGGGIDEIHGNNQIGTFNVSALSAQVMAAVEKKEEISSNMVPEEDVSDTPAYRLFTLQRDSTRYAETIAVDGYDGSLMDFLSIDADTTCYFCIPRSQWPSPE